jgi:hypothetical protein
MIYRRLIFLMLVFLLTACTEEKKDDIYFYWGLDSEISVKQLIKSNINYKVENGEIWIKEKDRKKAIVCCS